jgi:hypothetical protein
MEMKTTQFLTIATLIVALAACSANSAEDYDIVIFGPETVAG